MKLNKNFSILLLALLSFTFLTTIIAQDFPLRAKYPKTNPISTEQLNAEYGKGIIIIDVRSTVEYEVIHVKDASHVRWGQRTFPNDLAKAVNNNKAAKIAFYCNGVSCAKSYKAAKEAMELGYTNTFVYDAGVMDWTQTYPDKAVLLGKTPVDKSKLIADKDFKSRLLDKETFMKQAADPSVLAVDIRDAAQRKAKVDLNKKVMLSPMDKMVKTLSQPKFKENNIDKTIYFFDAVGKQVRWFQYYLNEAGYTKYYFLKGGVAAL